MGGGHDLGVPSPSPAPKAPPLDMAQRAWTTCSPPRTWLSHGREPHVDALVYVSGVLEEISAKKSCKHQRQPAEREQRTDFEPRRRARGRRKRSTARVRDSFCRKKNTNSIAMARRTGRSIEAWEFDVARDVREFGTAFLQDAQKLPPLREVSGEEKDDEYL